jgi:hypothetical protein
LASFVLTQGQERKLIRRIDHRGTGVYYKTNKWCPLGIYWSDILPESRAQEKVAVRSILSASHWVRVACEYDGISNLRQSAFAIGFSLLVDYLFYGRWIFVIWNFIQFNVIADAG